MNNRILQGVGVSPGIAVGPARLLFDTGRDVAEREIGEEEVPGEIARFEDALIATRHQLDAIRQHVSESIGDRPAAIFDAHLLMIDDPSFIEKVIDGLRQNKKNAESVLRGVMEEDSIVAALDILPSDAATLNQTRIIGIATELGGHTSHAAIMARALEIPAVAGLDGLSQSVAPGDVLLIDGTRGQVVVNPTPVQRTQYGHIEHVRHDLLKRLKENRSDPAETLDGRRIRVCANLELADHVERVHDSGADGIGLFRTEFLFLSRPDLPDEDEQAAAYEAVAQAMAPAPVVIRTLDAGGDKLLSHLHLKEQSDSALGCRGIRLSLARPEVFKVQLRAILRAARSGNISLMYPMVSGADEIRQANELLACAVEELRKEGLDFEPDLPVGVMLEVPSAALTADLLAPQVSFFSLGTNDLAQYTLAVDRLDPLMAGLYEPAHPGVLRLIRQTLELAGGTRISVCGEMVGNLLLVPLLIGLGVTEISVSPASVPLIKHLIRNIRYADADVLAGEALKGLTAKDILVACQNLLERNVPELKELWG